MKIRIDILTGKTKEVPDDYDNRSMRYLVLTEEQFQEREARRSFGWWNPPAQIEKPQKAGE